MTDYRPNPYGVHLAFDDGTSIDVSTLDAILLLSLLSRDRAKLENHIFPGTHDEDAACPDEYARLRDRTEKLLDRAKQLTAKRGNSLLRTPHLAACPHCGHLHDSRLIEQCAVNPLSNSILRLPWPMRCSVAGCGRLAHNAITVPAPGELGAWVMRPLCHSCTFYPERWRHWIDTAELDTAPQTAIP